jgi:ribA/ribD-fused uncharacterized protein
MQRKDEIMSEKDPQKMLAASKRIVDYAKKQKDWEDMEYNVMLNANQAKYLQNSTARAVLMSSGVTTLAECSRDKKWGIGFSLEDPEKEKNGKWTGDNLQGNILMSIRQEFAEKQAMEIANGGGENKL